MARLGSLPSLLFLVLLINGCIAQIEQLPLQIQGGSPWKQHRFHTNKPCRLEKLRVQEPYQKFEAEAGFTEVWDETDPQFECGGASFARYVIEPKGLLLPSHSTSPLIAFVVQGAAIQGVAIPGCPETFQTDDRSSKGPGFKDQHQKIRRLSVGDTFVVPSGAVHWIYNRGQSNLVIVALFDTRNVANQLDQVLRKFYLAGSRQLTRERSSRKGSSEQGYNVLRAFDDDILVEAFKIDRSLVQKLKEDDIGRDRIVRVDDDLEVLLPERDEEERYERRGHYENDDKNGFEETICTLRLKHNIGRPDRADVFNPRGGRISTVNSHNLPALGPLQLSAERGVLYSNAMIAPHYVLNAHTIMYVTSGSGRVQVVDDRGESVFDGQVQEGQVLIIPQSFVVVKKAGEKGFEWIAFKTNDNAVSNWLAGRTSQFRHFPLSVLTNSYDITKDEARSLKYSRGEMVVLSPVRIQGRD